MTIEDARREVGETCRVLRRFGLVVGTAGNVSVRVDDLVAVSPSGLEIGEVARRLRATGPQDGPAQA